MRGHNRAIYPFVPIVHPDQKAEMDARARRAMGPSLDEPIRIALPRSLLAPWSPDVAPRVNEALPVARAQH